MSYHRKGRNRVSGFLDKMGDFFFKNENDPVEDATVFEEPGERRTADNYGAAKNSERKPGKKSNLVSVPSRGKTADGLEIVLFKATTYDDMQEIARNIKERKIAVVNFEDMDKDVAQRMVDFLSGAAFALDGVPRKVSGGTFIFSSSQVDMSGQIMENENSGVKAEDFTEDSRFSSNQWLRP